VVITLDSHVVPIAVPRTPAALGTPLQAGPAAVSATRVPIVLAATVAVVMSTTPRNSADIELRRSATAETATGFDI
jgi:hypothetical protein